MRAMSDPTKIPGASSLVPKVYDDVFQPAAQEVGRSLHGVVKAVLWPVNRLVWSFEKASEWVTERAADILERRSVPPERIITPKPQIIAGVIRGIQATGSDTQPELREMYSALLATSMDSAG